MKAREIRSEIAEMNSRIAKGMAKDLGIAEWEATNCVRIGNSGGHDGPVKLTVSWSSTSERDNTLALAYAKWITKAVKMAESSHLNGQVEEW